MERRLIWPSERATLIRAHLIPKPAPEIGELLLRLEFIPAEQLL